MRNEKIVLCWEREQRGDQKQRAIQRGKDSTSTLCRHYGLLYYTINDTKDNLSKPVELDSDMLKGYCNPP